MRSILNIEIFEKKIEENYKNINKSWMVYKLTILIKFNKMILLFIPKKSLIPSILPNKTCKNYFLKNMIKKIKIIKKKIFSPKLLHFLCNKL